MYGLIDSVVFAVQGDLDGEDPADFAHFPLLARCVLFVALVVESLLVVALDARLRHDKWLGIAEGPGRGVVRVELVVDVRLALIALLVGLALVKSQCPAGEAVLRWG